jgi:type II secretory pathway pseudopilin PulG
VVRRRRDVGMTLVEIMITLIISSIIAASTFMFFAGQQRIYETQTKLLNIQQNLWAAMEVLARYARASGSGMYECVRPASFYNTTANDGTRLLSTGPSPGPLTPSLTVRPQAGLRAFNATAGAMQWIPPLWIVNNSTTDPNVVANTDIISVAFGNQTSGTDVDATLLLDVATSAPGATIALTGVNTGNMFRLGEFILLLSTPSWGYGTNPTVDRGCTMFQITSDPAGGTTLAHANTFAINSGDIVWNPNGNVAGMLPVGGYVNNAAGVRNFGQLTWVTFFIQTGANGIPNLMMQQRHLGGASGQPQVLAEGIEDLQVSFACDTGILGFYDLTAINGQLDEGSGGGMQADEWWNNTPNDTLPGMNTNGYCNLPTAIRLTLVARTLMIDDLIDPAVTQNGPMNVEDHVYPSPMPANQLDQFRRRVLTTTVYPRNNKPL